MRLFLLSLAACNSGARPVEVHELGAFEYEMPSGWHAEARTEAGRQVVEWTPKPNDHKESITLIQSEPLAAMANAGTDIVLGHLFEAQRGLGGAFDAPTLTTSKHGFKVARIEGSFTPPDRTQPYRRTHAVVIVDDRLVHIFYTAERATANRDALSAVINSFNRKGA
jgi:hypothetical protein